MERFIERYAPGTSYLIGFGLPSKEILRVAEREQVEVLVIGSHRGGGILEHLFSSSTTKKILRRAPCSVEIVPLPLENEEELQSKPKM
jgi:nucleotide-binding universal stress UspA family protein